MVGQTSSCSWKILGLYLSRMLWPLLLTGGGLVGLNYHAAKELEDSKGSSRYECFIRNKISIMAKFYCEFDVPGIFIFTYYI